MRIARLRLPVPASRVSRGLLAALVASTLFASLPDAARADELQDVSKLVKGNKLDEAGRRADAYLVGKPKDAQMRFLKGVILSQTGHRDEAVAMFTALTQDYPELPEPYNNIAAIYAAQGSYDNARAALETAVRVAPGYATAYENLGDVYAALAARAYGDARRLDATNRSALRKQEASRALLAGTPVAAASSATTSTASGATPSAAPRSTAPPTQANIGLPRPAGPPAAAAGFGAVAPEIIATPGSTAPPSGSNIVAVENSTPAGATSDETSTLTLAAPSASQVMADVSAAVQQWAVTRNTRVSDLRIRVDGDAATANLRAEKAGKALRKDLSLTRRGGTWFVVGERDAAS